MFNQIKTKYNEKQNNYYSRSVQNSRICVFFHDTCKNNTRKHKFCNI